MSESAIVFSPSATQAKLKVASDALRVVEQLVVKDPDSAQAAADWLGDLQDELKAIREMKDSALKPMRESEKQIRDWFRPVEETLTQAVTAVKGKIGEYTLANEQRQREAFTRASELHAAGDHISARAEIQQANHHASNRKPSGASTREVWEAEIVDAAAVPRDWCVPDETRIAALARTTPASAEPAHIPGVRYVKKVIVVGRPRKK